MSGYEHGPQYGTPPWESEGKQYEGDPEGALAALRKRAEWGPSPGLQGMAGYLNDVESLAAIVAEAQGKSVSERVQGLVKELRGAGSAMARDQVRMDMRSALDSPEMKQWEKDMKQWKKAGGEGERPVHPAVAYESDESTRFQKEITDELIALLEGELGSETE